MYVFLIDCYYFKFNRRNQASKKKGRFFGGLSNQTKHKHASCIRYFESAWRFLQPDCSKSLVAVSGNIHACLSQTEHLSNTPSLCPPPSSRHSEFDRRFPSEQDRSGDGLPSR